MSVLIIESGPLEIRAAVIENGEPVEFHLRRTDQPSRLGEIWHCRVLTCDRANGAAFVDLGPAGRGFLRLKDAGGPLVEGQALTVEVIRDVTGDKAARVAGRPGPAPPADAAPACLRPAPAPAVGLARQLSAGTTERVIVEGPDAAALRAALGPAVELHRGPRLAFADWDLDEAFAQALERTVLLAPHGRLTIDELEALTAIDIDAGGGPPGPVNRQAVIRAAAEIRRRNLSGQVLLDPVRLSGAEMAKLHGDLARALAADPRRPELARGTLDGLMLVTRKRLGPSLRQAATEAMPDGDGRRLSTRHLAARLLRLVEAARRAAPGARLHATVPPDVAAWAAAWPGLRDSRLEIACGTARNVALVQA